MATGSEDYLKAGKNNNGITIDYEKTRRTHKTAEKQSKENVDLSL